MRLKGLLIIQLGSKRWRAPKALENPPEILQYSSRNINVVTDRSHSVIT